MKMDFLPMPLESFGILTAISYGWFALLLRRSEMIALAGFIPYLTLCAVFVALRVISTRNVKEATAQLTVSLLLLLPALYILWIR